MKWKLELVETKRGCAMCETTPRFDVVVNGARTGKQVAFNMRGFIGYLPTPTGSSVDIGERPITAFHKEVSRLNREAKAL